MISVRTNLLRQQNAASKFPTENSFLSEIMAMRPYKETVK